MDLQLQRKTALVTGSTRGIGLAIAKALLREGCNVVLNSRGTFDAQQLSGEERIENTMHVSGDVTELEDCKRLVKAVLNRWDALDILICNVGGGKSVLPGKETVEEWERMVRLNLLSASNMIQAAWESLGMSRGTVLCVSSICGLEVVNGAPVTYSAAKSALNALVRGLARPLGSLGVRINAVAPGNVLFDGSVWDHKLKQAPEETAEYIRRNVSLQRLGRPEEVADLVAFLVSPRGAFATGSIYVLDGGQVRS
jgi:NAD(P)-dependent dehydrogenase (short-subunit alcohol dehydrogenase family)